MFYCLLKVRMMKKDKKKVIQFGAGNIGRGFLGQLFSESGYETVFVETREEIVSSLNQRRYYKLRIIEKDNSRDLIIKNVRAINSQNEAKVVEEIKTGDLMASAVGVRNLSFIASLIKRGMIQRFKNGIEKPINLIICENLPEADKVFKEYLLQGLNSQDKKYIESSLGLVDSIIGRTVPFVPIEMRKEDPTFIVAESYSVLPVDKKGFKGQIPYVKGMTLCDNLKAYKDQKLFIYNAGHAILAYLGYQKKYRYIWQAIADNEIRKVFLGALEEAGNALMKKYQFEPQEFHSFIDDLIRRFSNKDLGDTTARVGRDPIRKLSPTERLIGAANLTLEYRIIPENITRGIAAALFFNQEEDKEAVKLAELREKKGIDEVLKNICQIDPQGKLAQLIKNHTKKSLERFSGVF